MTHCFGDGPDGKDPLRPTCNSPLFGSGQIYHCSELDCPIHGERNKLMELAEREDLKA
jgi:hypothetical protein